MYAPMIGNVVADPQLKFLDTGKATCSFTVAVKEKRGEEEYTSFFDCTAWGTLAENVANSIHKGDRVVLAGKPKQRSYTDKDGNKRSAVEFQIEGIGHDLRWQTSITTKNQ